MKKILGGVICCSFLLGMYTVLNTHQTSNIGGISVIVTPDPVFIHPDQFYSELLFYQGVKQVDATKFTQQPIFGGVIPHHLLASFLIADLYARLKAQQPETIILIGPNHYERGSFSVLTSDGSWSTAQGEVVADSTKVKDLVDHNLAAIDYGVLTLEHSVATHMAFMAHYLPQTRVIPLILSGYLTPSEIDKLVDYLAPLVSPTTVVITSIDFSHYLSEREAETNDRVTKQAIQDHDYKLLMHLNNDYLDSPPTLVTLLKLMEKKQKSPVFIANTNSGSLLDNPSIETTSYFEIIFP